MGAAADAPAATSEAQKMGISFFSITGVFSSGFFLRGFFDAKWRR
jgi:hypothetical protein